MESSDLSCQPGTSTDDLDAIKAESILDQILSSNETDFRMVVSSKNRYNAEYIAEFLKKKYGSDVEVEVISAEEFNEKHLYRPPYKKVRKDIPRHTENESSAAPLIDEEVSTTFLCRYCGEQIVASKKPEWSIKAKHALLHLKYETQFSCLYCNFKCDRPIPMFKHGPLAHNNKFDTHLYPVFKGTVAAEKFNECVEGCFPGTKCLSMIEEATNLEETLPANSMYYKLDLGRSKVPLRHQLKVLINGKMSDSLLKAEESSNSNDSTSELQVCPLCEYSSTSSQFLTDHIQLAHDPASQKVECEICGLSCSNAQFLDDHMKLAHTAGSNSEELLLCDQCDYQAANKCFLEDHVKIAHGEAIE